MCHPESQKKGGQAEKIFEEIMAKMFLNLAKDINLHNQELSKQEKEKKKKNRERYSRTLCAQTSTNWKERKKSGKQ